MECAIKYKLWSPCIRWLELKDEVKVWFEATKEVMEELEVVEEEESVGKLWTDGGRIKSFSSVASFLFFRLQHWPSSCPNSARSLLTWLVIVVLQLFRDSLSTSLSLSTKFVLLNILSYKCLGKMIILDKIVQLKLIGYN